MESAFTISNEQAGEIAYALQQYAQITLKEGNYAKTHELLAKAQTLSHTITKEHSLILIECSFKLSKWQEVIQKSTQLLDESELSTENKVSLLYSRAIAYLRTNNRHSGYTDLEACLQLAPNHRDALYNSYITCLLNKNFGMAKIWIDQVRALEPNDVLYIYHQAFISWKVGDIDQLRKDIELLKGKKDNEPLVLMLNTYIQLLDGDMKLAIQTYKKAVEALPPRPWNSACMEMIYPLNLELSSRIPLQEPVEEATQRFHGLDSDLQERIRDEIAQVLDTGSQPGIRGPQEPSSGSMIESSSSDEEYLPNGRKRAAPSIETRTRTRQRVS